MAVVRGIFRAPPEVEWRLDGSAADATAPLVLAVHGMGMDHDFFAVLLQRLFDLPVHFLIPKAPIPSPGVSKTGASWYDYDGNQDRFRAELRRTEQLLLALVGSCEQEQQLRPRQRVLLGFSQGGYCGSWVALRHPEVFHGMIVSGARVKTEFLEDAARDAASTGFRALLLHGLRDRAVKLDAAQSSYNALQRAGVDVTLQTFDSGHSLGAAQIAAIRDWLQGFLQSGPGSAARER